VREITFVLVGSLAMAPGSSQETGFLVRSFKSPVIETTRHYAVYVPERYPSSKEAWPLIVFLHGRGESGDDIDLVRKHGPILEAMSRPDFPFLVVAPQCPRLPFERVLSAWRDHTPDVLLALDEVKSQYRMDPKRIYLTGLSMGSARSISPPTTPIYLRRWRRFVEEASRSAFPPYARFPSGSSTVNRIQSCR